MPPKGSFRRHRDEIRDLVKTQLDMGIPGKQIAKFNGVSPAFVARMNKERKTPVETLEAVKRKRGLRSKITLKGREAMRDFIEENPTAYRAKVADFLREEFNIKVSESTVSRAQKQARLSRKRLGVVVNRQQDEELRARFRARMARYRVD